MSGSNFDNGGFVMNYFVLYLFIYFLKILIHHTDHDTCHANFMQLQGKKE